MIADVAAAKDAAMAHLDELLAQFKLSGAPRMAPPARHGAAPAAVSPVRALGRRLAGAFAGNAAVKQDEWEEF